MSIFQIINYVSEGNIKMLTSFKYLYERRNEKSSVKRKDDKNRK